MNFFTITRLQQLTVVCLIILIASWPVINRFKRSNLAKEQIYEAARVQLGIVQANESFVREAVGSDVAHNEIALAIDDAYTKSMVDVRKAASPHLVSILSLSVGTRQLDAKGVALRDVTEPASSGQSLRKIRVRMKGRYESLTEFLAFLDQVKASPAIIRAVEINKDQFDVELLVLGV